MQKAPDCPFAFPPHMLEQAFHRARAELHAAETAAVAEEAQQATFPSASHLDEEPLGERLLIGHELLLAVRAPIEWLLALARRLATGDAEDVASIDRLTAAFHSRLAGHGLGVRVADVLTAFGILVGALDPGVVLEAANKTLADGVITILAYEGADLAAQIVRLAEALPTSSHSTHRPRGRRARTSR